MSSTVIRFAFAFFVLACVGAAAWTSEDQQQRAEELVAETWIPKMCSAWSAYHESAAQACSTAAEVEVTTSEESLSPTLEACHAAACSSASEAVFRRAEGDRVEASDAPYRH